MNTTTPRHLVVDRTPKSCEDARRYYSLRVLQPPPAVYLDTVARDSESPLRLAEGLSEVGRMGKEKAACFSVVSAIGVKAAPAGLDRRVGGHRERIVEGISSHTSAPLPLENAFVLWGYGGVLSPSLHPAEQLITCL